MALVLVSLLMPDRAPEALLSWSRASAVGGNCSFSWGGCLRAGIPIWNASARVGAAVTSAWVPGWRSWKRAAEWVRKGRICGSASWATSNVGGVFEMVSWMNGRATLARGPDGAGHAGERAERRVQRDEHVGLRLGHGSHLGRRVRQRGHEPAQSGLRGAQVPRHRLESDGERGRGAQLPGG